MVDHLDCLQAEMLLECLEVGSAYAAEVEEFKEAMKRAGKQVTALPPPPAIMSAYNASTPAEFLQEVLAKIKSRFGYG